MPRLRASILTGLIIALSLANRPASADEVVFVTPQNATTTASTPTPPPTALQIVQQSMQSLADRAQDQFDYRLALIAQRVAQHAALTLAEPAQHTNHLKAAHRELDAIPLDRLPPQAQPLIHATRHALNSLDHQPTPAPSQSILPPTPSNANANSVVPTAPPPPSATPVKTEPTATSPPKTSSFRLPATNALHTPTPNIRTIPNAAKPNVDRAQALFLPARNTAMPTLWITLALLVVAVAGFIAYRYGSRLTIKAKLIALTVATGIAAVAIVGSISLTSAEHALQQRESAKLQAIAANRKDQVETYFAFIHEQIRNFAQNPMTAEATYNFADAFWYLPTETNLDTSETGPVVASINRYYDQDFRSELASRDPDATYRGAQHYLPKTEAGRILQAWYISDNPNALGEKLNLDAHPQTAQYNTWHAKYHPVIRRYLESFGYYDIFLFDTKGNLVYSVFKETDYATNFLTGPYRDSNFGDVVREALASNTPGDVFSSDFAHYEPSYGAPAAFFGSPVFRGGEKIGVAVFQAPVDEINRVLNNAAGLGETGQSFLVGHDHKMRSQDRFAEQGTILASERNNVAIEQALQGQAGFHTYTDENGDPFFAASAPLDIQDFDWAIVTEITEQEAMAAAAALRWRLLAFGTGIATLVAIFGWWFASQLVKPIAPVVQRARAIAEGDLSGEPLPVKTQDELGQLTLAMNQMSTSLRDVIESVTLASTEVGAAAGQIANSSEEVAMGMDEQSAQVSRVSAAIEEMSASVVEVARKSSDAASQAGNAGQLATDGGSVVEATIAGMQGISAAVESSADSVRTLGKRGEQIGEIVATINDIADQTNLLALNAAIEAARAGEHGRGFAVVADEVRKLADRTTAATEEIAQSIQAIQQETTDAVERMDTGTDQVAEGVVKASEAGDALGRIVDSANQVTGMIQSIAAAAEEQSAASDEVARSVEQIAQVAASTADGGKQAATAAAQLANKAEELQAMCSRFRLSA